MTCECRVCKYAAAVTENLGKIENNEVAAFFDDMYERLCDVEMDRDVNKAIIHGNWPDARRILAQHWPELEAMETKA